TGSRIQASLKAEDVNAGVHNALKILNDRDLVYRATDQAVGDLHAGVISAGHGEQLSGSCRSVTTIRPDLVGVGVVDLVIGLVVETDRREAFESRRFGDLGAETCVHDSDTWPAFSDRLSQGRNRPVPRLRLCCGAHAVPGLR